MRRPVAATTVALTNGDDEPEALKLGVIIGSFIAVAALAEIIFAMQAKQHSAKVLVRLLHSGRRIGLLSFPSQSKHNLTDSS